jgi:hypothetical protein
MRRVQSLNTQTQRVKQVTQYYTLLQTRTHALILERRFSLEGIPCELTYMPREIMSDLCNLGIKFSQNDYPRAMKVITNSGLPGCIVYRELMSPYESNYEKVYS